MTKYLKDKYNKSKTSSGSGSTSKMYDVIDTRGFWEPMKLEIVEY